MFSSVPISWDISNILQEQKLTWWDHNFRKIFSANAYGKWRILEFPVLNNYLGQVSTNPGKLKPRPSGLLVARPYIEKARSPGNDAGKIKEIINRVALRFRYTKMEVAVGQQENTFCLYLYNKSILHRPRFKQKSKTAKPTKSSLACMHGIEVP